MTVDARTSVPIPNVAEAFEALMQHIEEHDIDLEHISASHARFTRDGCEFDFRHNGTALTVHLYAPNENMLYFLREAVAAQISEIDPAAGSSVSWADLERSVNADGAPVNFQKLTLQDRRIIFPGMIRLTLNAERIASLLDGLHVKLMRPPKGYIDDPEWPRVADNGVTVWPNGESELHVRYYTLRDVRPEKNEVDIDVVQHAGGMIADWAEHANIGDQIGLMGPAGEPSLPNTDGPVLLAGDETALPAIARILEAAPAPMDGTVLIAFPEQADPYFYLPDTAMNVISVPSDQFKTKCTEITKELVASDLAYTYAWFGGEAQTANEMRRLFKSDLKLGKGDQLSVAYWQEGALGDVDRH